MCHYEHLIKRISFSDWFWIRSEILKVKKRYALIIDQTKK